MELKHAWREETQISWRAIGTQTKHTHHKVRCPCAFIFISFHFHMCRWFFFYYYCPIGSVLEWFIIMILYWPWFLTCELILGWQVKNDKCTQTTTHDRLTFSSKRNKYFRSLCLFKNAFWIGAVVSIFFLCAMHRSKRKQQQQ